MDRDRLKKRLFAVSRNMVSILLDLSILFFAARIGWIQGLYGEPESHMAGAVLEGGAFAAGCLCSYLFRSEESLSLSIVNCLTVMLGMIASIEFGVAAAHGLAW